jgi:hypothetical protein
MDAQLITGGSSSTTVTVCGHDAVPPPASVAVQVTTVVPRGSATGASLVMLGEPQLSVTVAEPRSGVAVHSPGLVPSVTSAGHAIEGGSQSTTVTVCGQEAQLPATSQAVQVTVVAPSRSFAGASLVRLATPQLSLATAGVNSTAAVQAPGSAQVVTSSAQVIIGGSASCTVTVC